MAVNKKSVMKKVDKLTSELGGEIALTVLFDESFMCEVSNLHSIGEFFSPIGVKTQEDFDKWADSPDETYVRNNTTFLFWSQMFSAAAKKYAVRQLMERREGKKKKSTSVGRDAYSKIKVNLNFTVK